MSEDYLDNYKASFDAKQAKYKAHRKWMREMWEISDAEDWCARKEVEPGTYKPLSECDH